MLPIGTLIRNLNTKLRGTNNKDLGFFKHDICGHILGGALLTDAGEGLAILFQTILHPSFEGGEEEIIQVLTENVPSGFGPSLSDSEIDSYTTMLLYYRSFYRMDGTNQLVQKILNSYKVKENASNF